MKKRITVEFEDDDILFIKLMEYINNNCLTITSAIKQAVKKLLEI